MTANALMTTPPQQAPLAGPPPLRVPRPVRATTHAGGVPYELLLTPADGTPSALDVDPRLLVVQRRAAATATPPRRTLAPPSDDRREQWERRRRMWLTAGVSFGGAVATGLSVATALA